MTWRTSLSTAKGVAIASIVLASTLPALAQTVACPPGYGYSYGYGCVPVASPVYAPPVAVVPPPPVYDPFGIVFGFGDGYRGDGYRGDGYRGDRYHDGDWHHGGYDHHDHR